MLRRLSIRTQFLIVTFLSLLLVTAGITTVRIVNERNALIEAERSRGQALIGSVNLIIQSASPRASTFREILDLHTRMQDLAEQNDDIDFIAVAAPDGTVYAHSQLEYEGRTRVDLAQADPERTVRVALEDFGPVYLTSGQFDSPIRQEQGRFNILVGAAAEPLDAQQRDSLISSLVIGFGTAALVGVLTFLYLQYGVTLPIRQLTTGAEMLREGNLEYRVEPGGSRELRELGHVLNDMAHDLQQSRVQVEEASRSLEDRLEERTRELTTVSEVGTQISTLLHVPDLLQAVTDLTRDNFNLYHAHIYLLDEAGDILVLTAGSGEVGRQMVASGHRIPLKTPQSIVARAARTRQAIIQNDVRQSPDFLPNPLLPHTRSELAVALVARGELLGVLDVQSDRVGRFDANAPLALTILAQQISVALSNARLFTVTERTSRHEHALSSISEQIQGALNMDEVLEVATRELGKALRVPHTAIELQLRPDPEPAGQG